MAVYEFKCDACEVVEAVWASMNDELKSPLCPQCGKPMRRLYAASIHIPEHMQASGDSISPTEIGNRLNSSRPSGRRKVFY
jgi:putative FmdB family regulatory protein